MSKVTGPGIYVDSSTQKLHYIGSDQSDNTVGSGSGSVTSFSAGTLSPLFTTSVATATTTPALSFSLTNAAAGTLFANFSGSSGAPSYNAPGTADQVLGVAHTGGGLEYKTVAAGTGISVTPTAGTLTIANTGGTVTSFSSGNLSPLFTTSVATATTTPAESYTLSNANAGTIFGNFGTSAGAPSYNAPGTANQLLKTNNAGTGLEWGTISSSSPDVTVAPGAGVVTLNSLSQSATVTTVAGGVAGNLYWSQPFRGAAYKKVVVALAGYNDASGATITFPTAFAHTPGYINSAGVALVSTVSTTQLVIPAAAGITGTIIVEGI